MSIILHHSVIVTSHVPQVVLILFNAFYQMVPAVQKLFVQKTLLSTFAICHHSIHNLVTPNGTSIRWWEIGEIAMLGTWYCASPLLPRDVPIKVNHVGSILEQ